MAFARSARQGAPLALTPAEHLLERERALTQFGRISEQTTDELSNLDGAKQEVVRRSMLEVVGKQQACPP